MDHPAETRISRAIATDHTQSSIRPSTDYDIVQLFSKRVHFTAAGSHCCKEHFDRVNSIPKISRALLLPLHGAIKIPPDHRFCCVRMQRLLETCREAHGRGAGHSHFLFFGNPHQLPCFDSRHGQRLVNEDGHSPIGHFAELREMDPSVDAFQH